MGQGFSDGVIRKTGDRLHEILVFDKVVHEGVVLTIEEFESFAVEKWHFRGAFVDLFRMAVDAVEDQVEHRSWAGNLVLEEIEKSPNLT